MFTGNNKTYIYKANIEPKEQYNEIDIRTVTDYTKTIDLSEELGTQFPNNYYDVIQKQILVNHNFILVVMMLTYFIL